MASSSLHRLRQIYAQKPTSTAAVAEGISTIYHKTIDKASSSPTTAVATEGNIESIVNKFKKSSSHAGFRRKRLMYKTTVIRLAKSGHSSYIHDILDHQKQYPDIKNEHFTARLITLYGKAEMLDHALHLFDEMPDLNCPRTVLSYNALLAACLSSKNFTKAIEIFQGFPEKLCIEPNVISYTAAMKAFCQLGLLDKAISLLDEMEKKGLVPSAISFETLLSESYRRGEFSEGEKIWNLIKEKNVIPDLRSYNWRMNGLVNEKRILEAVQLMQNEMVEKGLKPNNYTYGVLIKGFVNEGNLEETKKLYTKMVELQVEPLFFTIIALIDFGCRRNDADFCLELCNKFIGLRKRISSSALQKVVNLLVEQSRLDEAKQLLEVINSWRGSLYNKLSLSAAQE